MSGPITLHVMLDDVRDLYSALLNEIRHCEREHTICQVRACAELISYYDKRLASLYELGLYLKRKMEDKHDQGLGT